MGVYAMRRMYTCASGTETPGLVPLFVRKINRYVIGRHGGWFAAAFSALVFRYSLLSTLQAIHWLTEAVSGG